MTPQISRIIKCWSPYFPPVTYFLWNGTVSVIRLRIPNLLYNRHNYNILARRDFATHAVCQQITHYYHPLVPFCALPHPCWLKKENMWLPVCLPECSFEIRPDFLQQNCQVVSTIQTNLSYESWVLGQTLLVVEWHRLPKMTRIQSNTLQTTIMGKTHRIQSKGSIIMLVVRLRRVKGQMRHGFSSSEGMKTFWIKADNGIIWGMRGVTTNTRKDRDR